MKPQTPEELYADGEDLEAEGMLIIGDKGKILCDFRGTAPRLIPRSRQQAFAGSVAVPEFDATSPEDEWVNAIKSGKKSRGSFEEVAALAEAVTLAGIALRVPYKRLLWDSAADGVHERSRSQRLRPARAVPAKGGRRKSSEVVARATCLRRLRHLRGP